MNDQTLRLRWGKQPDVSLALSGIANRVAGAFANFLKAVFVAKKVETRAQEIEQAECIAFPLRMVPIAAGYRDQVCPECGSDDLIGALLSPDADEADANVFCRTCSYVN